MFIVLNNYNLLTALLPKNMDHCIGHCTVPFVCNYITHMCDGGHGQSEGEAITHLCDGGHGQSEGDAITHLCDGGHCQSEGESDPGYVCCTKTCSTPDQHQEQGPDEFGGHGSVQRHRRQLLCAE